MASCSKSQALNSNYSRYPGLDVKHSINETFFITKSKTSPTRYFPLIADCLSFDELLTTTAHLNRQFRSMTFAYFKCQVPRTEKILKVFIAHVESVKKGDEPIYSKEIIELNALLDDLQKKLISDCDPTKFPDAVLSYRLFSANVIDTTKNCFLKIVSILSQMDREHLPKLLVDLFNGISPPDHNQLPNVFNHMVILLANLLELQKGKPVSDQATKWGKKYIEAGLDLELIETIYIKLENLKDYRLSYYPLVAYAFKKLNKREELLFLFTGCDNSGKQECRRLCSNACLIAEVETETLLKVKEIFNETVFLLSPVSDPDHFSGSEEIANALIKAAIKENDIDFAKSVLDFFCNKYRMLNCDQAIDTFGFYLLNRGEIQTAIRIFLNYGSFGTEDDLHQEHMNSMGISLGKKILSHFLNINIELALQFVNNPEILPSKRGFLQEILVKYYLDKQNFDNALALALQIDPRYPKRARVFVNLAIYLAEQENVDVLLSLMNHFRCYKEDLITFTKIFLTYKRPDLAFALISRLDLSKVNTLSSYSLKDELFVELVKYYLNIGEYASIEKILEVLNNQKDEGYNGKSYNCLWTVTLHYKKIKNYNKAIETIERLKKDSIRNDRYKLLYINILILLEEKEKAKEFVNSFGNHPLNQIYLDAIESGTELPKWMCADSLS